MSKFCVRKPFTVLVGVVMVIVLGIISFTRITTDLFPTITLPYVVAITTYPGATPERVESSVTEVLESSLGTVNGVENVTSTSSENFSMVMLEFEDDTNMDSAIVKLSTAIEQISGVLPEEAGTPMLMEISPDMLPTMTMSIDYDGMDVKELSKFAEKTLIPYLERQAGVASVSTTGLTEESVEIRLNQGKINNVNDRLLAELDGKFAEAKQALDDSEAKLSQAAGEIASGKSQLQSQQDSTYEELAKYSQMLDGALASAASYEAQVNGLKTSQAALGAEKQAYEEQLVPAYNQLNEALGMIPGGMFPGGETLSVSSILADETQETFNKVKESIEQMLPMMPDNEEKAQLAALNEAFTWENLSTMEEKVTTRIPQIDTELANLDTEIMAAQAVLDQVNAQVEAAKNNYASVEMGKLSAAAAFGAASAQLAAGESELTSAQAQLDEAREQYNTARETAMESANIDAMVTKDTLSQIIYAQNFEMPAGYIKEGESQFLLRIGDQFETLDELKNVLLVSMDGIGDVRLTDVADVGMIDNSGDSYAKINGNDGVILSVMKSSASGTSEVSRTLNEAIEELETKYEGLHITPLMDQGEYIKLIIDSVLQNLIYGAVLAIIVLALFLKDFKPTVVIAFSIPMSVLFAIVLMYFSNVTLNVISLSGLALGVGMLVDNSIVVIENIYRLRSEGVPAPKAAVLGARQVSGAIFASTLTTICVFLPIVFTDGLTRELFTDMGLTIAYSLLASLFVALTFVPTMSATVLKKSRDKKHPWFDAVIHMYEKALRFCLRWKVVPIGISIALLVLAFSAAAKMGLSLFPSMSSDSISVNVVMNDELDQETIYKQADEILEKIGKIEGVETVGAMAGGSGMSVSSMAGSGTTGEKQIRYTLYVILDEEHANDGEKAAKEAEKIGVGREDQFEITASASAMDMSALSGSGMEIDIKGDDIDTLLAVSEDVMGILNQVKGFENVSNGQEEGDMGIKLALDKDAAMRNGLTVAQIFGELSAKLTTQKTASALTLEGEEYDVIIVDENNLLTKENLLDYAFETTKRDAEGNEEKETHKLSEFASVEDANSIASIQRDNQARHITVSATTMEGYNTTLLSRDVKDLLEDYKAPEGYSVEIAGEVTNIEDTMIDLLKMIALACAFIYMIMVAQFQSLLSPFIVIFTIPLAFTGGLLAIWISGETLSVVAMLGFLVLAGVVVNNGIVFVDYVNQLRLAGREKKEALVETGKTRMRPILMTALTTILAMSTMAFSQEATAQMSKGMAIVTIGGLTYATFMTLFIVPVLYDIFFRRKLQVIDVDSDVEIEEENIVLAIDASMGEESLQKSEIEKDDMEEQKEN
ncbi:MAG: MMPL family transporter [Coprococcus sp.]|nr:MMPL family transporter [Coprococcus sp.]